MAAINKTQATTPTENNTLRLPLITEIQNRLLVQRLKKRILTLDTLFFEPHVITIEGCKNLRRIPNQHFFSSILSLFTEAALPHNYILKITTNTLNDDYPHIVSIHVITYRVKLYVFSVLNQFFTTQYTQKAVNIYKN
jgi:hypothetical protein